MNRGKIIYTILLFSLLTGCSSNKYQKRFLITSETMSPTINPGDYIIEDSSFTTFTYGDIVGYRFAGDKNFEPYDDVLRIVALPGDSIAVEKDICIVNGKKNPTKFIKKDGINSEIEEILPNGLTIHIWYLKPMPGKTNDFSTILIPQNHYFIMGDLRSASVDSRYFGTVPKDKITGKVIEIIKQDE